MGRFERWKAAAAAVVLAAAIVGCGSGGEDASTAAAGGDGGGEPNASLRLAVLSASAPTAPIYIAQVKGFFEDHGVDVEILSNTGNNTPNMVASRRADVALMGTAGALLLADRGIDTAIVSGATGGGAGGTLVGKEGITRLEQLRGQRIGTLGKGTSVYGYGATYSAANDLDADLVPFESPGAVAGALAAGRIAGAVGPYSGFSDLLEKGDANMIVDTRDPDARVEVLGPDFPEGAIFGLADELAGKRPAVEGYLAAIAQANDYIARTDDAQVATDLRTLDEFKSTPQDVLEDSLAGSRTQLSINGGRITPELWDLTLRAIGQWGIDGVDPADPAYAYDERVDMSYLDAAVSR